MLLFKLFSPYGNGIIRRKKVNARSVQPPDKVIIINIEIRENDGLFIATSHQLPEINVAHPNLHDIYDDLPNIIGAICKDRFGIEMQIIPALADIEERQKVGSPSWVAIPPELCQLQHG